MCRNTANKINFHYRTNSVNIIAKIFQYIKKTLFSVHFWFIFPIFWAKIFFWKIQLSRTSYGFLAPCQNLVRTNGTIPRKCLDKWKDEQTLFYRTLPVTAGGPVRRFFMDWKRFSFTLSVKISQMSGWNHLKKSDRRWAYTVTEKYLNNLKPLVFSTPLE